MRLKGEFRRERWYSWVALGVVLAGVFTILHLVKIGEGGWAWAIAALLVIVAASLVILDIREAKRNKRGAINEKNT